MMRAISPPSASISRTSWPLALPPIEGLHASVQMRSGSPVSSSVSTPIRAAANAASTPAWPPPTTITAASSKRVGFIASMVPRAGALLADAEAGEDRIEERLARIGAAQLTQRRARRKQIARKQVERRAPFNRFGRLIERAPSFQNGGCLARGSQMRMREVEGLAAADQPHERAAHVFDRTRVERAAEKRFR